MQALVSFLCCLRKFLSLGQVYSQDCLTAEAWKHLPFLCALAVTPSTQTCRGTAPYLLAGGALLHPWRSQPPLPLAQVPSWKLGAAGLQPRVVTALCSEAQRPPFGPEAQSPKCWLLDPGRSQPGAELTCMRGLCSLGAQRGAEVAGLVQAQSLGPAPVWRCLLFHALRIPPFLPHRSVQTFADKSKQEALKNDLVEALKRKQQC